MLIFKFQYNYDNVRISVNVMYYTIRYKSISVMANLNPRVQIKSVERRVFDLVVSTSV